MFTAVTYLGSIGLGMALVAIGLILASNDADVEADAEADTDGDAIGEGLSVLSMAGIGALLVGFGATGYVCLWLRQPLVIQALSGVAGALLVFRLTAWVKRLVVRNLESGRSEGEHDLLYQPATVSIPVPAGDRGRGQVLVHKGIKTFYVTATYRGERELAAGESVVIIGVSDGVYVVEPFSPTE